MANEPTVPAPCATSADPNDWRCGDLDNSVRRKILNRLKEIGELLSNGTQVEVKLEPGDIEIGAVEIKDSGSNNRATVGADGCLSVSVCNFPATQPVSGTVSVDNFPATQPVSGTVSVDNFPAVQAISSTQLPAALVGTRLDCNVGAWLGSTAPTVGQKTMADSIPVVIASDQSAIPISGTVAVSNFPATQPVSGTVSVDNFPDTQQVCSEGTLSSVNSSSVSLTAFSSFSGTYEDVLNVGTITVSVLATFADTVNGEAEVSLKFSDNGTSDSQIYFAGTIASGIAQTFIVPPGAKFFKVDVDNADSNMTFFHLQTIYKCFAVSTPMRTTCPDTGDVGVVTRNIPCGTQSVEGTKSNNGSLPGSNNLGTLPAVATTAVPAYTNTAQVALSTNLAGSLRVINPTQLPAALVGARLDCNIGAWLGSTAPTVGQKTMANSIPVVIASDQSAVPVSGTVAVSGSIAVTNAGTFAAQDSQTITDNAAFTDGTSKVFMSGFVFDETAGTALTENDAAAARIDSKRAIVNVIEDTTTRGQRLTITAANAAKVDGSAVTQPTSSTQLPAALVGARLDCNIGAWLGSTAPTVGQKTMANSVPVAIASDQALVVSTKTALTASSPTFATVGVTSAQAVASNSGRKGLVLVNTSSNTISLGFGATAVVGSGITLAAGDSYTMDEYSFHTGAINAIASAASSNLAIQEFTT